MSLIDSFMSPSTGSGGTATASTSSWDKAQEFALSLAEIWGGVELAKEQTDQLQYQSKLAALTNQLSQPYSETQTIDQGTVSQPSYGAGQSSGDGLLLLALVGLGVYMVAE